MKRRDFKTVLDELVEELDKEGHTEHYHATFDTSDKVKFGNFSIKLPNNPDGLREQYNQTGSSNPKITKSQLNDLPDGTQQHQLKLPPSSTIQSAVYWPTKEYLLVSFKSGATYSYNDVPRLTIEFWQSAASAGSWFYYNIRMSYNYQRMG